MEDIRYPRVPRFSKIGYPKEKAQWKGADHETYITQQSWYLFREWVEERWIYHQQQKKNMNGIYGWCQHLKIN